MIMNEKFLRWSRRNVCFVSSWRPRAVTLGCIRQYLFLDLGNGTEERTGQLKMIKLTRYGHAIRQLQPRWTSLQHVKNATTGWRRIRAYRTRPSGNRPFGTSSSSPSTTSSWRNTNVAHGVAVAVVGDKIILKDLARGAVGNIVRFENGSEGKST